MFRGVRLPPGEHGRVRLPAGSFRIGLWLSVAALVALLGWSPVSGVAPHGRGERVGAARNQTGRQTVRKY